MNDHWQKLLEGRMYEAQICWPEPSLSLDFEVRPGVIVWLLAVMLVAVSGHATSSWAAQTPTEVVERTMKDMLYILTELKDASRSAQRQWEIEQVVRRAFNYEEMAERSLGRPGSSRMLQSAGSLCDSLCRCYAMIWRTTCETILRPKWSISLKETMPTEHKS